MKVDSLFPVFFLARIDVGGAAGQNPERKALVSCPARARLPARNVSPRERVGSGDKTRKAWVRDLGGNGNQGCLESELGVSVNSFCTPVTGSQ